MSFFRVPLTKESLSHVLLEEGPTAQSYGLSRHLAVARTPSAINAARVVTFVEESAVSVKVENVCSRRVVLLSVYRLHGGSWLTSINFFATEDDADVHRFGYSLMQDFFRSCRVSCRRSHAVASHTLV